MLPWPLYLFYFDGETGSAACVLRATTKNFFWGKNASGWPGWRIFWPRNDLALLLRLRRHCTSSHSVKNTIPVLVHEVHHVHSHGEIGNRNSHSRCWPRQMRLNLSETGPQINLLINFCFVWKISHHLQSWCPYGNVRVRTLDQRPCGHRFDSGL